MTPPLYDPPSIWTPQKPTVPVVKKNYRYDVMIKTLADTLTLGLTNMQYGKENRRKIDSDP